MMKKLLTVLLCLTLVAALVLTGCGEKKASGNVVAVVGDEEITAEEFEYFLMMTMYTEVSNSGQTEVDKSYWTEELVDEMMEQALDQSVLTHTYRLTAKDNGIELSDEDLAAIDESISQGEEYYGKDGFDVFFKAQNLTVDLYKDLSLRNFYASALYEEYSKDAVSDDEVKQAFKKDYVKAKHILILSKNEETGEDISADAYTKIEGIKAQLDGGADFDVLMNEYCEDPGLETNPDGYVFTKGEMVPEFEEAAFALEPGQVSDIVTTDYGYHIIKKVELTDEDLKTETYDSYGNAMTLEEVIRGNLSSNSFNEYLASEKEKYNVDINTELYDSYKASAADMYEQFKKESDEYSAQLTEIMAKKQEEAAAAAEAAPEATEPTDAESHEGHNHE